VGCAGLISPNGVIHLSPHLPWMNGFALGDAVRAAAAVPAIVDNDANAAAWGERCIGAGRNADELVMVTLGTGIGGGIVMGGHLLVGTHGFAGEVGHMVVDRHGPVHVTGMRGPWELYGSGTGLGKLMRDAAHRGQLAAAVAAAGSIDELRGEHLEALLVAHDAEALAVLDHFGADVALGIANVVTILDPEIVVIGGGVVELGAPLFAAIDRHLDEVLFARRDRPSLRVVPAVLGEQAGAIGAALRGRELVE
jgi:glucokinase